MLADDVREVFETILPEETIERCIVETKFQLREHKLQVMALLRAMIIAASTGYGGRQADILRIYLESGVPKVVRGAFYSWFGKPLATLMASVSRFALDYVQAQPVDLPGWLGSGVKDWRIVDSSTVKLDNRLKDIYPGTGDYAALKIHKTYSVGVGAAVDYHISPAREHDSKHLHINESWKGYGLLADLGYVSHQRLLDCEKHQVHFVVRLKSNWRPGLLTLEQGTVKGKLIRGADFDFHLREKRIALDGQPIDARVVLNSGQKCRLVGVSSDSGYHFYLTSLPKRFTPLQISDLYRVRWEIESDNKIDKSCSHLGEIGARTQASVEALVHASMVSSIMINLIAYHHRRRECQPTKGEQRTTPPIHPQTLGRVVGSASQRIGEAMSLTGEKAQQRWQELTDYFVHLGHDPNWRSRPSILDQLRGWRLSGKPKSSRLIASSISILATS